MKSARLRLITDIALALAFGIAFLPFFLMLTAAGLSGAGAVNLLLVAWTGIWMLLRIPVTGGLLGTAAVLMIPAAGLFLPYVSLMPVFMALALAIRRLGARQRARISGNRVSPKRISVRWRHVPGPKAVAGEALIGIASVGMVFLLSPITAAGWAAACWLFFLMQAFHGVLFGREYPAAPGNDFSGSHSVPAYHDHAGNDRSFEKARQSLEDLLAEEGA